MRENEVRIKYIDDISFNPFTLEIDILTEEHLSAYINLFDGWDDRIHRKLLKVEQDLIQKRIKK